MLTLLCRVKIKPEIFKVDGKTSFYIIFYFKIMSQLWDTRFNEGGRHQSNSSVAVFSLSVNFNDNGSDLFIFSLPSPAVLFSACQRNGIWGPLKRLFMKPQICAFEKYIWYWEQLWEGARWSAPHAALLWTDHPRGKLWVSDICDEWSL